MIHISSLHHSTIASDGAVVHLTLTKAVSDQRHTRPSGINRDKQQIKWDFLHVAIPALPERCSTATPTSPFSNPMDNIHANGIRVYYP